MTQYGTPAYVKMMADERRPIDRKIDMGDELWHRTRKDVYFCLDDPKLSPMHKSIIEQIASLRYEGRR